MLCLCVQQLDPPHQDQLNSALNSVAQQLRRLADVPWLCSIIDPSDQEVEHWIVLLWLLKPNLHMLKLLLLGLGPNNLTVGKQTDLSVMINTC